MRRVLAAVLLSLPSAVLAQTAKPDPKLAISDVALIDNGAAAEPTEIAPPSGGGADTGLILGQIVNIAKQVWTIVEENKPVVDVNTQYAVAVPSGTATWGQLSGWKPPKGEIYELVAKNGYGMQVVRLRYEVLRTYGGGVHGKGKYLTAVTAQPLFIDTAWG